jgi:hypothetical protein
MAMVAIVTLAKTVYDVIKITQQSNNSNNKITIKQPQTIAVQGRKSCPQLATLDLNHFKIVEDMGLKIMALRST